MSNDEEWNVKREKEEEEREKSKVRWEMSDIKEELIFDLDDLYDDLQDELEELRDEAEDIKDDLRDELEELMEEREDLLQEVGDMRGELEQSGEYAKEKIEHAEEKLEQLKDKIKKHEMKFNEKVRKKLEKAKKKAARINISVDPDMSDEWKDWAEGLGASVSELVRKSMRFVKNNIGDIAKLEKLGRNLEEMGVDIEQAVKDSGIGDIGEKLEKKFGKGKGKHKVVMTIDKESNKERVKKRVNGLIKLHNSLPLDKLAQAIGKSNEDAENLVYELVADGIEGTLEEGVFKFTSPSEEVISKLDELIDKI